MKRIEMVQSPPGAQDQFGVWNNQEMLGALMDPFVHGSPGGAAANYLQLHVTVW